MDAATEQAVYAVADATEISVRRVKSKATGDARKVARYMPIPLKLNPKLTSDFIGDGRMGAVVHLAGCLWLYVYSSMRGKDPVLWLAVFGAESGAKADSFCTGSPEHTVAELKPVIRAWYKHSGGQWAECQVQDVTY